MRLMIHIQLLNLRVQHKCEHTKLIFTRGVTFHFENPGQSLWKKVKLDWENQILAFWVHFRYTETPFPEKKTSLELWRTINKYWSHLLWISTSKFLSLLLHEELHSDVLLREYLWELCQELLYHLLDCQYKVYFWIRCLIQLGHVKLVW